VDDWPLIQPDDGGRAVHALQNLLESHGFFMDDEDHMYWQNGPSTVGATKYFQASARLPQTGIADPATWKALLGYRDFGRGPKVLEEKYSGGEFSEDLAEDCQNRVYLIGEDRWENASY